MLTIRHYVAKSAIEGCGLFCAERIAKGDVIFRYDFRFVMLVSDAEIATLNAGMREAVLKYSYRGTGKDKLVGAVYYCIDDSRFMNHSSDPNSIWVPADETYIAANDVPAHTELTCDYADFCDPSELCFQF